MATVGRMGQSSVPGGLFAAPPDLQVRDRLDGQAHGRGNSSSVSGGIFGGGENMPFNQQANDSAKFQATKSSIPGGIFGGGADAAAYFGGPSASGAGAAGGRSNGQADLFGHFRGGTKGGANGTAFDQAAGGRATNAGQMNGHFRGGTTRPGGPSPRNSQFSARDGGDDFLDRLGEAEQKDEEDEQDMLTVQAASDRHMIAAAAAQLADEQGLSGEEQQALEAQLYNRLQEQAHEILVDGRGEEMPRAMYT